MISRPRLVSGLVCLALAVALGAVIVTAAGAGPLAMDAWWNTLVVQTRADAVVAAAHALDHFGGGWVAWIVTPAAIIAGLLIARRWRSAIFAGVALAASAIAVQILKHLFARARPEDMLVTSDFGSFPSGHTANAATAAVVLFVVFPRLWVALAGLVWVVAMALSRTILSVHWLTDTAGGALVGAGVALIAAALAGTAVARDREAVAGRKEAAR